MNRMTLVASAVAATIVALPGPATAARGGTSIWQRASANGQRVENRQPLGKRSGGGTVPGMVASRPSRRPSEGSDPISPSV